MDETNDTTIAGRRGEYCAPENFCRAVFLQIAARITRKRAGRAGRELGKFFSSQADAAFESRAGFALWDHFPDGPEFGDSVRRELLLAAVQEIVGALEVAHEAPESWNTCPRWSEWGVAKARELLAFLRREAEGL